MHFVQALLLGALQGLTEFLPVSSSGHLVLAQSLMGIRDVPQLFDIILHMATLCVVAGVFHRRIALVCAALFRWSTRRVREPDRENLRLFLHIIAATAVTTAVGLLCNSLNVREKPATVSALFIATALILIAGARAKGHKSLTAIGWKESLLVGAAQGLGVFPGISRSGISIGTGILAGLDRKAAGEFSFLISIPAILGAFVLMLKDSSELAAAVPPLSLAAGFVSALVSGYIALKILLWLISSGRLWVFALYLIPLGIWGLIRF